MNATDKMLSEMNESLKTLAEQAERQADLLDMIRKAIEASTEASIAARHENSEPMWEVPYHGRTDSAGNPIN